MISDKDQCVILSHIAEANHGQLAEIIEHVLIVLGRHGRDASELLLGRIKDGPREALLDEGLAQIIAVEGVLDGRLESL